MLTFDRANELLKYNSETGDLIWIGRTSNRIKIGDIAGAVRPDCRGYTSYIDVGIDGVRYPAHRIIWLLKTGVMPIHDIDHIDGNGLNNCWDNLRQGTRSQNLINTKMFSHNTSGYKGVSYRSDTKKWAAYIMVNKRKINLGCYDCPKEASDARNAYAKSEFGEWVK